MSTHHVPDNVCDDDCALPETITIGRHVYGLEWYEARHGARSLVMYGARWSGQVQVYPGQLWTSARSAAKAASRDR